MSELEFNGEELWKLQEKGREDAKKALNAGESTTFNMLDDWMNNKELKSQFNSFGDYV